MAIAALAIAQSNHITHFGDPLRVGLVIFEDDGSSAILDLRSPQLEDLERVQQEGLTVNRTYAPPPGDSER